VLWQHVVLCKWYAAKGVPDYVCLVLCGLSVSKKCDFSKEQCSSLKMILGSKYVGAILNVLI